MKRWAFNIAAAVSLLLCVGTVGLWVRSYRSADELQWYHAYGPTTPTAGAPRRWHEPPANARPGTLLSISSSCGGMVLRKQQMDNYIATTGKGRVQFEEFRNGWHRFTGPAAPLSRSGIAEHGFGPVRYRSGRSGPSFLILRSWFIVTVFSLAPAAWATLFIRSRGRQTPDRCENCGYDLRATRDRCPECGTPTTAGVKA